MAHLVFIHGIANKPTSDELLQIWRRRLAQDEEDNPGVRLGAKGIKSSMIYWADVMYAAADPDVSAHESAEMEVANGVPTEAEIDWNEGADDPAEAAWQAAFAKQYGIDPDAPFAQEPVGPLSVALERIPLPWVLKRPFMKLMARDTHHYLFNTTHAPRPGESYKVRDEIRARFVALLKEAKAQGGPLVLMAHSQGTIVAYDCLKNVPDCPQIDALITVGSPLGLDEVQDKLAPGYSRSDGFPSEKVAGPWHNVYDRLDIVSRPDPKLANDFLKEGMVAISDHVQTNQGAWRHSMTEYLSGRQLRAVVRSVFDLPGPTV